MADVDPVTGLPKETVDTKNNINRFNRLDSQKIRYDQLKTDIVSENGQVILNKIKEHLLARINKLMDEDGECRSLKKLLVDMGVTISMGEMAVDKLMKIVTK